MSTTSYMSAVVSTHECQNSWCKSHFQITELHVHVKLQCKIWLIWEQFQLSMLRPTIYGKTRNNIHSVSSIVFDLCTNNSKQDELFSTVQNSKHLDGLHSKLVLCTLSIVWTVEKLSFWIIGAWCSWFAQNSKFNSDKDLLARLECYVETTFTQAFFLNFH